jgi:hypothetical protein
MSKKRDAAYFRARLKKDFPTYFADLKAGKYKNVSQASVAAGLIRPSNRIDALKRDWKGATGAQRKKFLDWVTLTRTGLKPRTPVAPRSDIADSSGILIPSVAAFLRKWLKTYNTTPGRIMLAMGYRNYDPRLAEALNRPRPLPADVMRDLTSWLRAQACPGV